MAASGQFKILMLISPPEEDRMRISTFCFWATIALAMIVLYTGGADMIFPAG